MPTYGKLEGKFVIGELFCTPGVADKLNPNEVVRALHRHVRGDWGDVGREDWDENDLSLREGFRLLSSYRSRDGTKFWLITEADRSMTTVLLPEEY